jgi:hypothetical protein
MTNPRLYLPLNDWLDRFERAHPEILISAPWATQSGCWQVIAPGYEPTLFESGELMRAAMESRYPT